MIQPQSPDVHCLVGQGTIHNSGNLLSFSSPPPPPPLHSAIPAEAHRLLGQICCSRYSADRFTCVDCTIGLPLKSGVIYDENIYSTSISTPASALLTVVVEETSVDVAVSIAFLGAGDTFSPHESSTATSLAKVDDFVPVMLEAEEENYNLFKLINGLNMEVIPRS